MPRRSKGPRLWLRPARHDAAGNITHQATWIVRDGTREGRTGLGVGASEEEKSEALTNYLTGKHTEIAASVGVRDPSVIPVDDVLAQWIIDVVVPSEEGGKKVEGHADFHATLARITHLKAYWSGKMLSEVNGNACDKYASQRSTASAARRELEDLRAAINHHRRRGLHDRLITISLSGKSKPREKWFERDDAAAAIWAAYRYREVQKGNETTKYPRRHIARFMVFARWMGSRSAVICSTSIADKRPPGVPWCDLKRGMFYGLPEGERETKKRRQRVRIPLPLLAHLRRWRKLGHKWVVEWQGKPALDIHKGHDGAIFDAGLDDDYTPHIWRHTVATWLMQNGADPWRTASFLAMSLETLLRVYGHHRPDDSAAVHAAFHAHRRHRYATDIREQKVISDDFGVPKTPIESTKPG